VKIGVLRAGLGKAMLGPWFTERQLCAVFRENGYADITRSKVSRWGGQGYLPLKKIRGVRYYSPEAFGQAIAIRDLLLKKEKLEFVGKELWLLGFWVDRKHWKPQLENAAANFDRHQKYFRSRVDADDTPSSYNTLFDRVAGIEKPNFILSRMRGRLGLKDRAIAFPAWMILGHPRALRLEKHGDPRMKRLQ
jgi:hypothetical protein